jgi:hypothetical protein
MLCRNDGTPFSGRGVTLRDSVCKYSEFWFHSFCKYLFLVFCVLWSANYLPAMRLERKVRSMVSTVLLRGVHIESSAMPAERPQLTLFGSDVCCKLLRRRQTAVVF